MGNDLAAPSLRAGSDQDFVLLTKHLPGVVVERPYETTANVFGQRLYTDSYCFLRRGTAKKLAAAAALLKQQGYKLKVWDGYRPRSVQRVMWRLTPDRRYVADPARGSTHNRGAAVDVTLVRLSGEPVEMPSGYDDFSVRAHHDYQGGNAQARRHRSLLSEAMKQAGFRPLRTEWWHWEDTDRNRYSLCDKTAAEIMR